MNKHTVAVYGSLRKGLYNHPVLAGAKYLRDTETDFPANLRSLGSFPYVHTTNVNSSSPVKVELYEVDDKGLERLDFLEGYPSFYNRTEFKFADGTVAWMYHIEDEEDSKHLQIKDGDWVKHCKEMKNEYC